MRKAFLSLCITCLLLALLPTVNAGRVAVTRNEIVPADESDATLEYTSNLIYDSLGLGDMGLSRPALKYAYKGYRSLLKKGTIANPDLLSVCDFSQSSGQKRLYIIDVKNYKLLVNTYVAHGKNSGLQYAKKFSNRPESLQSSLGFYVTKGTYFGKHGLSLRLAGMDKGYNSNAEKRAIVMHGAGYIGETNLRSAYMGRSFGCPAVPQAQSSKIINLIKDGTCLFIYHPSNSYLHGSRILNG